MIKLGKISSFDLLIILRMINEFKVLELFCGLDNLIKAFEKHLSE